MALNDDSSVTPSINNTVLGDEEDTRCLYFDYNYDITTAVVCGMYLVFGVVYTLYGYRCFKAVMFLTGFIFGSVVVYLICLEESLLSTAGNSGVALGAGLLFGLITMLVQYVGLFMTGFHMGLFVGVASIMIAYLWYSPTTVWITVGILLGCGLVGAVVTLFFQKVRPSRKARQVNLQRIRREETRAEQRQRKYRYLYQVRTAHGDVISQSYIQSLQTKVCPPDDSLTTIHSDLTRLTVLNPSASTTTTLSQVA
ncbi:transmembrane protein 198-like [Limulus polyphemus]|uniref:Transmembrane protein 198 n=1 Tax=Limulus polyphemus TaxID=6850 RepID=A0ABM1B9X7_LIMPO|nr:transmembrane protein 198-like [Limulus polyphemus]